MVFCFEGLDPRGLIAFEIRRDERSVLLCHHLLGGNSGSAVIKCGAAVSCDISQRLRELGLTKNLAGFEQRTFRQENSSGALVSRE